MGEADGGSPGAAQGAQTVGTGRNRGLLARLIGMFAPPDPPQGMSAEAGAAGAPPPLQQARPGMGNLHRMRVADVAIPKAEIVSVPVDIRKDDLVQVFRDSGLSRLPVYEGTLDNPIGLIHLKDLALSHGFNGTGCRYNLRKMVRPLLFAPPSMPIGVLLQKMQTERIHMALVIDEYGGVDGLVTIEDLIEQVVGDIADEHDGEDDRLWVQERPGCYSADARAPLAAFEAEIGMKLADPETEDEVDTLGGLVFVLTGRVPARGEVVSHPAGPEFEVLDADARRIKRLRVRLGAQCCDD